MEMEERDRLYEEVQKIIEESISSYIKDTIDELTSRIEELKSRINQEIETKENEKLNEVQNAIDENVHSNEIAEETKNRAEEIAKSKQSELEQRLDEIIKEKVGQKENEFENTIEKAIKSKDTQEKISHEIINWISVHQDFLTDVLEGKVKSIISEKKEKDITRSIEEFIKSGDFRDMIKLQFMNYLATSRDAFTQAAKEALREQIEREGSKVLKDAMKDIDAIVRQVIEKEVEESLGERFDSVVSELKTTIEELKKQVEEIKNASMNSSTPSTTTEPEPATKQPELELEDNIDEHIEGLSKDEGNEVVEEEPVGEGAIVEERPSEEPEAESVTRIAPEERGIRLTDILRVKYYGHSSFLISNSKVKIIMDPYKKGALDGAINYEPIEDIADIVTVSHGHMDHAGWKEIPGNPVLVEAEGEKVVNGIKFKGIPAFHDKAHGALRGSIMIFSVEISGAKLVHLGDLGHVLTNDQVREIGLVDILIIPVGGYFTIDAEDAWQVIDQLDPLVVVPVHYKTPYVDLPISDVSGFTSRAEQYGYKVDELGTSEIEIERLPRKKTVWIFEPANVS